MVTEEENEPDPPRNFTLAQLRYFNGEADSKSNNTKSVYLSLNGIVFDVTKGKDFFGQGGAYELFSGRECGAALAKKMIKEELLDDIDQCSTLNDEEITILEEWIDKFTYHKQYPIMGRLIPKHLLPSPDRVISKKDLAVYDGTSDIPDGYAASPIYVSIKDKVFDVSFGGVTMYSKTCSYSRFAAKDISYALAKMSFKQEDIDNTNISNLSEKETKILNDWLHLFEGKKQYPCVGRLEK